MRGSDGGAWLLAQLSGVMAGTDLLLLPINVGIVGSEPRKPKDHGWTRLVDEVK